METEKHHHPLLDSQDGGRNGFSGVIQWEAAGLGTALADEKYFYDHSSSRGLISGGRRYCWTVMNGE